MIHLLSLLQKFVVLISTGVVPASQPTTQPTGLALASAASDDWSDQADVRKLKTTGERIASSAAEFNTTGRGQADDGVQLAVLAPEEVGKTAQAQPALFWHLSRATTRPIEISISQEGSPLPLKRWRLNPPQGPGFHEIDLAAQGVTLEIGRSYEFVVAIVQDPRRRSRDVVAIGYIQRVPADPTLAQQISGLRRIERVEPLAAAGLFYDASGDAVIAIEANATNPSAQAYRSQLLAELQLTETSSADVRAK